MEFMKGKFPELCSLKTYEADALERAGVARGRYGYQWWKVARDERHSLLQREAYIANVGHEPPVMNAAAALQFRYARLKTDRAVIIAGARS